MMGAMKATGATIVEIDDPSWTEFVATHPHSTVFHTQAWVSVVADCYGFRSFAVVVQRGGEIVAGCPVVEVRRPFGGRRWVSLPFTDECRFLAREGVESSVIGTLAELADAEGVADLEIRSSLASDEGAFPVRRGFHHRIPLPENPDDLHVRKSYRHLRNRARREGITVRRGESRQDVDDFYRLHVMTRRRHGVPVQPKRFFDLIAGRLVEAGDGFVLIAEDQGRPAAAGLFLSHKDTLVTKFAASDPTMRDTGAGHLLDWTSLDAACRHGYRFMDWGRTDLEADGLRTYKLGWGAIETDLVYTHLGQRSPDATGPRVGTAAKAVIRHSPEWVCRLLGELLYRGAA